MPQSSRPPRNISDPYSNDYAKTDYAGNGGEQFAANTLGNPNPDYNTLVLAGKRYFIPWIKLSNGIFYNASETTFADITDGTSNTYLAGEKYVFPESSPTDWGESWNMYVGYDDDICRWTGTIDDVPVSDFVPRQEELGYYSLRWHMFGSAHAGGCNFVLCDGSVRLISYLIDAEVHRRLGNRMDGLTIDGSSSDQVTVQRPGRHVIPRGCEKMGTGSEPAHANPRGNGIQRGACPHFFPVHKKKASGMFFRRMIGFILAVGVFSLRDVRAGFPACARRRSMLRRPGPRPSKCTIPTRTAKSAGRNWTNVRAEGRSRSIRHQRRRHDHRREDHCADQQWQEKKIGRMQLECIVLQTASRWPARR